VISQVVITLLYLERQYTTDSLICLNAPQLLYREHLFFIICEQNVRFKISLYNRAQNQITRAWIGKWQATYS
jgi:hypothetical protein